MKRPIAFTQAQVRRAVKAAESAGLRVSGVTIGSDGSITVSSGQIQSMPMDSQLDHAASWDDA